MASLAVYRQGSTSAEDSTPKVSLGGEEVGVDEVLMSQEDFLFGVSNTRATFKDLGTHSSLAGALESCGKSTATIIQSKAFSAVSSGKDVVIGAETGSGKTMAFVVPLIQKCLEAKLEEEEEEESGGEEKDELDEFNLSKNYPRILVMVPNKELVLQVASMTQELLKALQKESASEDPVVTAETCTTQQGSWFYRDADAPDILICTPAIISKFIRGPTIEEPELFKTAKHVVFDEADMLLEGSYLRDVEKVLEAFRLTRREQVRSGEIGMNDKTTQFVLSAATLPTYGLKSMDSYIKKKFPEAVRVSNDHLHKHHPQIRQAFVELESSGSQEAPIMDAGRLGAVLAAIGPGPAGGSTMVFSNTADAALALAAALEDSGVECVQFHKGVPGREKQKGLQAFRDGEAGVLICTDAAARGLDLPSVSHVVQAEFALNVVQYLHRIGRASRGGREGRATSIVDVRSADLVRSIRSGEERSVAQSFSRKRGFRAKFKKAARGE